MTLVLFLEKRFTYILLVLLGLYFVTVLVASMYITPIQPQVHWIHESVLAIKFAQFTAMIAFGVSLIIAWINRLYLDTYRDESFWALTFITSVGMFTRFFEFVEFVPFVRSTYGRPFQPLYTIEWAFTNFIFTYLLGMISKASPWSLFRSAFEMEICIMSGFLALLNYGEDTTLNYVFTIVSWISLAFHINTSLAFFEDTKKYLITAHQTKIDTLKYMSITSWIAIGIVWELANWNLITIVQETIINCTLDFSVKFVYSLILLNCNYITSKQLDELETVKKATKLDLEDRRLKEGLDGFKQVMSNARAEVEKMPLIKVQNSFLAFLSQQLRTPLNEIVNYHLSLIKKHEDTSETKSVLRSSQILLNSIQNILELSELENTEFRALQKEFEILNLLDEVSEMFSSRFVNEIYINCPRMNLFLIGYQSYLRRVLQILIENALKFSQKPVDVNIILLKETEFDATLEFSVIDKGIGIETADTEKLFKKFSQLSSTSEGVGLGLFIAKKYTDIMGGDIIVRSEVGKGSIFSFTLRFAKSSREIEWNNRRKSIPHANPALCIVSEHQYVYLSQILNFCGVLSVQSNPEHGVQEIKAASDNKIQLDVIILDNETLKDPIIYSKLTDLSKSVKIGILCNFMEKFQIPPIFHSVRMSKPVLSSQLIKCIIGDDSQDKVKEESLKILVVDDNKMNRIVVGKLLTRIGYVCDYACDGKEAVMMVESKGNPHLAYDAIIMDCLMPEMDGFEATQQIRRLEQLGKVKSGHLIIALTANDSREFEERCYSSGMDHYTTKPVQVEVLRNKIENRWITKE